LSPSLFVKLLAIFAVIAIGWVAGRTRMLGPQAATTFGAAAFGIFTPALLFRTTAHVALTRLPWATIVGYYTPTLAILLAVYAWQRSTHSAQPARPVQPAVPAVRALAMSFSNTVQLGIPVAAALFGAVGLAIHITIASLQSLLLLTTSTVLVEIDLARASTDGRRALRLTAVTARRAFIHPVVLPVLLGLGYNLTGLPVPGPVDDVLATLGQAVIPVSLITIGLTLAHYGIAGNVARAVALSFGKLVVQPTAVFALTYWGLGLRGLPLRVAVLCAALPMGANVLLFAQRYDVLQAEATSAIVASTVAFLITGTLWLLLLHLV
jgi:malonate transporter and related proteins